MTHEEFISRVAKRTGYPEALIRNVLGAARETIRAAILHREEVTLRGLFTITPADRQQTVRSIKDGSTRKVGRLMLSIRPVQSFRDELNRWSTQGEPMEKFGVATNEEAFKQATAGGGTCPQCGGNDVSHRGSVPFCSKCGTSPWETGSGACDKEARPRKTTY